MTPKVENANLNQLNNSLKREIQEASKYLTNLLRENQDKLKKIDLQILEAQRILDETLARNEIHKKNIEDDLVSHKAVIATHQEKVKELQSKQNEADHKARYHDSMVGDSIEKLHSLDDEIEKVSSILESKKREIIAERVSLEFVEAQIATRHRDLDGLNDLVSVGKVQLQKDVSGLISQKKELEIEIFARQRSLDGFKSNAEAIRNALDLKRNDLYVLEQRLKKALTGAGIPYRI